MPNQKDLLGKTMSWYPGGAEGYLSDLQKGTGRMMGVQGLLSGMGLLKSAPATPPAPEPPTTAPANAGSPANGPWAGIDPFTKQPLPRPAAPPVSQQAPQPSAPAAAPASAQGGHGGLLAGVGLGGAALLLGEGGKVLREGKDLAKEALTAGVGAMPENKSYEEQLRDLPDADLDAHIANLQKQIKAQKKVPAPSPSPVAQ